MISEEFGINPYFAIGSTAIAGIIGSLMLEETLGVPMKNHIDEELELQKKWKIFYSYLVII